jgi:hypothetical protein
MRGSGEITKGVNSGISSDLNNFSLLLLIKASEGLRGWNHGMPACLGLSGVHRKQILSAFTSGNSHRKQGETYDEQ